MEMLIIQHMTNNFLSLSLLYMVLKNFIQSKQVQISFPILAGLLAVRNTKQYYKTLNSYQHEDMYWKNKH